MNFHSVQECLDPCLAWDCNINEGYVNLRELEEKDCRKTWDTLGKNCTVLGEGREVESVLP